MWRRIGLVILTVAAAGPAAAWGDLGHKVIAIIAYRHLDARAKAAVDGILAGDTDTLTAPDFASRAVWADKYVLQHKETMGWHFANVEIDKPDLKVACYDFPATPAGQPASAGPAKDCVVNKVDEFSAELKDPSTSADERLLALKFLMHFVGDLHQPLHVSDHQDRGANCITLAPSPDGDVTNLHLFWDVTTVRALGASADAIADALDNGVTPSKARRWSRTGPANWAEETLALARRDAYRVPTRPTCATPGAIALSPAYQSLARRDASRQLEIAGRRLAALLNADLGDGQR